MAAGVPGNAEANPAYRSGPGSAVVSTSIVLIAGAKLVCVDRVFGDARLIAAVIVPGPVFPERARGCPRRSTILRPIA
jgi:hypothetical protein